MSSGTRPQRAPASTRDPRGRRRGRASVEEKSEDIKASVTEGGPGEGQDQRRVREELRRRHKRVHARDGLQPGQPAHRHAGGARSRHRRRDAGGRQLWAPGGAAAATGACSRAWLWPSRTPCWTSSSIAASAATGLGRAHARRHLGQDGRMTERIFILSPASSGGRAGAHRDAPGSHVRPRPEAAQPRRRAPGRGFFVPERSLLPRQAHLRDRLCASDVRPAQGGLRRDALPGAGAAGAARGPADAAAVQGRSHRGPRSALPRAAHAGPGRGWPSRRRRRRSCCWAASRPTSTWSH